MTTTHTTDSPIAYVVRRNHSITPFDAHKIHTALMKAFLAVEGRQAFDSQRIQALVQRLTDQISEVLLTPSHQGLIHEDRPLLHIEDIQNQVERSLMQSDCYDVARAYILYREARATEREQQILPETPPVYHWIDMYETRQPIDLVRLRTVIEEACDGLADVDAEKIYNEAVRHLFDDMSEKDFYLTLVFAARPYIELEPNYSYVTARLLLDALRHEAMQVVYPINCSYEEPVQYYPTHHDMMTLDEGGYSVYADYLIDSIYHGIELGQLDPRLQSMDLIALSQALQPERDLQFTYLGLQTLYDRYFLHDRGQRFELPQTFFMRVAMGLAIEEDDPTARAIEFYHVLSTFDGMCSTPTLFNSGTVRAQLSSCFLTTIPDDLHGIYDSIKDNAMLSKFAGGLGNDWTAVRALGAHIRGTNGTSQGVVPFMKVANDTAVAVNQSGKRLGAVCAYLETWHLDIEEFLELRKNTGDERRRTHDMNTANWIPDLFMKRVMENADWTLFSPDEVPDLHDLYGQAFEDRYVTYERMVDNGALLQSKRLPAAQLWRKMLTMLVETGHPWLTFKDPCNIRYTNAHQGVVHSSNLCTEITLHTNADEIAVCNLASVNLVAHLNTEGELDQVKLQYTVQTLIRMLDNVINVNYYSVDKAHYSNYRHRPIGLGVMGFQDALYRRNVPYASKAAIQFADASMEAISYYALQASCALAQERGSYPSFEGSLWSQGILPYDAMQRLSVTRGKYLQLDLSHVIRRDTWDTLREDIQLHGLRNSNVLAIAPTATISNICGVSQSIEPTYQNLFVKSNLSGEFTIINPYLVEDLKALGLWDIPMLKDLKYYDGRLAEIPRIPGAIRAKYATAFEIDSRWLIDAAARRQKWIDQSQSLNCYIANPTGGIVDRVYKYAWIVGLKTTYYLRTLGATHVEKSTTMEAPVEGDNGPKLCAIDNPGCEACQ